MTERKVFTEVNANGETVKLTQIEIFKRLLKIDEVAESELFTDFLNYKINQLQKKASSAKGTTKNTENIELADRLYEMLLSSNAEATIAQILQTSDFNITKGFSTQKIAALLRILMADNKVEKIVVKRVNYYKAVEV